ncbi:MAG: hypothetical protein H5T61_09965 [Thermoflexales bacterium]|nr:hypothetical protein [Thermoflexales bacterium]
MLFNLLFLVACVLMLVGKDHTKCTTKFLTLNEEQMVGQWRVSDPLWPAFLPIQDRLGAQEVYRIILVNNDGGTIGHTVYRYCNRWLAAFHFWFDKAVFFPSISTEWSELQEANHWPLHADQRDVRCGVAIDPPLEDKCSAVLRYGVYISDFDASTSGAGAVSLEEFREIVLKIDERFQLCGE